MTDSNFPLSSDDDLPRTFRRARQEHEAAQRAAYPAQEPMVPIGSADPSLGHAPPPGITSAANPFADPAPATVRTFDVPFFHLMFFCIKAVFAAIPAVIILGLLIWLSGEFLTSYFPELLKMKIIIQLPN